MELLYALLSFLFFILIIVIFVQVWETDSNITSTPGTTKAITQATTQATTNDDSYWHWSNWYSIYTNIMNKITVIYVPQATLAPKTTYTTYGSTVPTTSPPTTSAATPYTETTYPPTTYTASPYTATTYPPTTYTETTYPPTTPLATIPGTTPGTTNRPIFSWITTQNMDYPDTNNNIEGTFPYFWTLDAAKKKCTELPECKGFTLDTTKGQAWFKKSLINSVQYTGRDFYTRVEPGNIP